MNAKGSMIIAIALLIVVSSLSFAAPASEADGGTSVLIDRGNGDTTWTVADGSSVLETVESAAEGLGMEVSFQSGELTVDGVSSVTVGRTNSGGSFTQEGSTGLTTEASWRVFGWSSGSWVSIDPNDPGAYGSLALAFLPEGVFPTETPDHPNAWTMSRGDSANTGSQDATFSSNEDYSVVWTSKGTAHANTLYAGGTVYQKFGIDRDGYASVVAIDGSTGETEWEFRFLSGSNYESSTPLIVGDSIYVATMTGYIYRIPLAEGPGEGNSNVTSFGGAGFSDAVPVDSVVADFDVGTTYDSGFSSMVFYSGAIYVTHSNGMVYCFDLDLNLIWSKLLGASTYLVAPTVYDGMVFTGALDGHLYIIDAYDGSMLVDEKVYQVQYRDKLYGNVGQVAVQRAGDGTYALFFTVSDGLGMSQGSSGLAVYEYAVSGNQVVQRFLSDDLGMFGRYVIPVDTEEYRGAYAVSSDGLTTSLLRVDRSGVLETVTTGLAEIHSPMVLVNGEFLYAISYSSADPIYKLSLSGEILGTASCPSQVRNFNMIPLLVLGDTVFGGTDAGIYCLDGAFTPYVPPSSDRGAPIILVIAGIVGAIILVMAAVYAALRFGKGVEKPFRFIRERFVHYLYGEDYTHNTRNRHRLRFVVAVGAVVTFLSFTLCICIGSTSVNNPVEAYSALFSAISKGGVGLDTLETSVYMSRLPRTIAALAVGIGLSVAGCIYQAIIRNPLVDPYIMGVSSGAGVAAIAVIAFDFTFFGLFSPHSIFITAITACVGGLIAFACTMLLAEKAGGSAINYVLSGVVIGLAFSAVQTIMLTMSGNKLSNALTWLYGSFAEVTWAQVGIILFLSLFLSMVPLLWAKELNLVLLGEDQARQMGLNVRRFNRGMLVLASVLTSVCVAFCGVIGFVGLVIPHLCRMLLGSDHRMVIPASICFGGVMLMLADLLARTGYYGMELPVGAITTVIGIPVFAYLLIKRGRMYDG